MDLHLANTLKIDEYITSNEKVLDQNDPENKVAFYVDEWGTWYDPEPGREPGFLYQQNSLRDALVAGLNFNVFHAHAKRVQMANIAQMVNVLQAMILTDGPRMTLTPTYHAFEMYIPFQGATYLPTEIRTPQYSLGQVTVPSVNVTAARDTGENSRSASSISIRARPPFRWILQAQGQRRDGRVLTAASMDAHNTFEAPQTVKPRPSARSVRVTSWCCACLPGRWRWSSFVRD
jgi:alpha-N-arabinofuranosidase